MVVLELMSHGENPAGLDPLFRGEARTAGAERNDEFPRQSAPLLCLATNEWRWAKVHVRGGFDGTQGSPGDVESGFNNGGGTSALFNKPSSVALMPTAMSTWPICSRSAAVRFRLCQP